MKSLMSVTAAALLVALSPALADAQSVPVKAKRGAGAEVLAGVRYRNFDSSQEQREVFLGRPELGADVDRAEQEVEWDPAGNDFTITWDGSTLTSSITNSHGNFETAHDLGPLGDLNYFHFLLLSRTAGTTLSIHDLRLDGVPVGGGDYRAVNDDVWRWWHAKELDLTDGFELTGTLSIDGPLPSGENTQFEFNMGYAPDSPLPQVAIVPTPTAAVAGLVALGVLALRRRRNN